MPVFRNIYILPALVLATGLPATGALFHYRLTGDPTLRPLGLSRTTLSGADRPSAAVELLIEVDWGADAPVALSEEGLRQALARAVSIYNVDTRIRLRKAPGDRLAIHLTVGRNRLGPFALHDLAGALPAALAAYRMHKAAAR